MNKVSDWNKLTNTQAFLTNDTASVLTSLKSWDSERTAVKEKNCAKHDSGLPGRTVSPTKLCLYAFFPVERSYTSRLKKKLKKSKNWPSYEKNSKNRNTAPGARARSWTNSDEPGVTSKSCWPIFMKIFFLSDQNWASWSLRREICVSLESSFFIFILGHLVKIIYIYSFKIVSLPISFWVKKI
jgi:hypothetical protein